MKSLNVFVTFFLLLLSPIAAHAAGTSFFEKGLMHPLIAPTQLIALFALGILLGQQGWRHIRLILPLFFITLSAALIMTQYQAASWNPEMILLPLAAIIGLILTLKRACFIAISLVIAVVVAVVIGMDSSVPTIPGLQARKIYASLLGTGLCIFGLLSVTTLIAFALKNPLQGVILRILGAWSAAGAILVLALLLAST